MFTLLTMLFCLLGMRPEHTVAAYELAVKQGADIIECDIGITKVSTFYASKFRAIKWDLLITQFDVVYNSPSSATRSRLQFAAV